MQRFFRFILTTSLVLPLVAGFAVGQESATAEQKAEEGYQITVYNSNLAVVKDRRKMAIPDGIGTVRFSDVATQIDPTSVHFESLSDAEGTSVLEQNYEYDLVSPTKLLDKYIDQDVTLYTKDGAITTGRLLSQNEGRIVLQPEGGPIQVISGGENLLRVDLVDLPEGLLTRPTLIWETQSEKGGDQLCQVTYMTGGVNWKADYVLVVENNDTQVDLTGWVTLDNQSGATYKNAKLKLIAGDVNRVQPPARPAMKMEYDMAFAAPHSAPQFEEKSFFEYHMYTLQRPSTIRNAQTKQVSLLSASDVAAKKVYVYDSQRDATKVDVKMEFKNAKENNMGMPLPKGLVRAFKADSDGSLEFVGEDQIDHTPKDEILRVLLGKAFDIVCERNQMEHKQISRIVVEDSYEIKIRNHKEEAVTVTVSEPAYGDWKVIKSSHEPRRKNATTLEFDIPVHADEEAILTYTLRTQY